MTTTSTESDRAARAERAQQRIEHLVLGRPRPPVEIGAKPKGVSKQEWRATKTELRTRGRELQPGIEEAVQLREQYGHRQGTPETHSQHEKANRPAGAIARLYASRAIDADQLSAAHQIASAYRAVTAGAPVRTASWETRINGGGAGGGRAEIELLGRSLDDLALDWWLRSIRGSAAAMLDVIVHDIGLTIVAQRYALSMPRARRMLGDALSLWWERFGRGRVVGS
jgi:hypothetical protein